MNQAVYYDTCIFLLQGNTAHPQCRACAALLEFPKISWTVAYGELSLHEAYIQELVREFEVQGALNGVTIVPVSMTAAEATAREHTSLKRSLRLLGFQGRDWKHLMAATWAEVDRLLTDDPDFWDPISKRVKDRHPKDGRVRRLIRKELGIGVNLPTDWLEEAGVTF